MSAPNGIRQLVLAAVICFWTAAVPQAGEPAIPHACAIRDMALATLIEKYDAAKLAAPEAVAHAAATVEHAWITCGEGRSTEALAIYDRVFAALRTASASRR